MCYNNYTFVGTVFTTVTNKSSWRGNEQLRGTETTNENASGMIE